MRVTRKPTHRCVFLVVRGKGISGGIFDMMRYDNCTPATEQESGKLEKLLWADRDEGVRSEWIVMRRFVETGARVDPTVDRWLSFGWECDQRAFEFFSDAESVARTRNDELKRKAAG